MNKKLIFRILGALASALIIVSVFVPFVSVTGYSYSIWGSNEVTNSLYLPIMIIVFGAIGVIFFSLNIKTEFAYMSTGAIAFFLIVQTVDILNQGVFNTLSIGYYCLVIGAVLTGLMTFLLNLKSNKNNVDYVPTMEESPNVLAQMDGLYNNDQTLQNNISPIQPIEPVVQPIPVQPVEIAEPIQPIEPVAPIQPIGEQQPNPVLESTQSIESTQMIESIQPVNTIQPIQSNETINTVAPIESVQPLESLQSIQPLEAQQVNPVLDQFNYNPVVQEFSMPTQSVEPVIQQQSLNNVEPMPNMSETESVNPVVQDFMNTGSLNKQQPNLNQQTQAVPQVNQTMGGVDIFGQLINK